VEFVRDERNQRPKLLEFNPRFWGSLHLAVACGVNFPYLLLSQALGEDFAPVKEYKVGVMGKWLFPGEILRLLSHPKMGTAFKEMLTTVNAEDFIYSRKDPLPLLGKMLSGVNLLFMPELRKIIKK